LFVVPCIQSYLKLFDGQIIYFEALNVNIYSDQLPYLVCSPKDLQHDLQHLCEWWDEGSKTSQSDSPWLNLAPTHHREHMVLSILLSLNPISLVFYII